MPVETSRSTAARAASPWRAALDGGALRLVHGPAAVPAARRALVTSLTAARAARDLVDDAAVVASELLGNAVRHAGPMREGGVLLRWRVVTEAVQPVQAVQVEVVDGGGGTGAGPSPRDVGPSATSGRGLRIVEALCSGWGSSTDAAGQRTVWATVAVADPVQRSA